MTDTPDQPGRPVLQRGDDWTSLNKGFRWPDWPEFDLVDSCCDNWAQVYPDRIALRVVQENNVEDVSYGALSEFSRRFANVLRADGVNATDRVAILLPQSLEVVLAHFASYRIGAIVVPLFYLFGEDALKVRLANCGAKAIITDCVGAAKIAAIADDLPNLDTVYCVDGAPGPARDFWQLTDRASDQSIPRLRAADTPAFLSYTSGTTGSPKGALHAHRVLLGHLPGVSLAYDFLGQPGDCLWTPADWAWMGGLTNVLLPGLYFGVPVVVHREKRFDPEAAADLIDRLSVRNVFMPPTALKLMRSAGVSEVSGVRSLASAGEPLGGEMLNWGLEVFGRPVNEFYGQTECNAVTANNSQLFPIRPGSAGRAAPGHRVGILDAHGETQAPGQTGEIAIAAPDPAMFLRYWDDPAKTAEKFCGRWMRTGDEGHLDEDGYLWFSARVDDVITSSGYRIGPSEIENCLTGHPDVSIAAVVGTPDPVRTQAVEAFVVLRDGANARSLSEILVERVRQRISPHVAPRRITFVSELPMTETGKIRRRALRKSE